MNPRTRPAARTSEAIPDAAEDGAPTRRGFTGAWVFLMSLVFFLVAIGVIPVEDSKLGAPRWAIAVILLAPMLCGLGVMAGAAGRATIGPVLGVPVPLPGFVARPLNQLLIGATALMFGFVGIMYWAWALRAMCLGSRTPSAKE